MPFLNYHSYVDFFQAENCKTREKLKCEIPNPPNCFIKQKIVKELENTEIFCTHWTETMFTDSVVTVEVTLQIS